jgi:hypothetical protein
MLKGLCLNLILFGKPVTFKTKIRKDARHPIIPGIFGLGVSGVTGEGPA